MKRPNGAIIYDGPSAIDGKPIIAIVTGLAKGSANGKTGDMLQTWIIRSDVEPHTALKTGDDASVCGGCIHRPANGGSCYVRVFQAPLSVYKSYHRGIYAVPESIAALGAGRQVRLGSYGDPAAVPVKVWEAFTSKADGWTGYTHQWKSARLAGGLKGLCQASVDNVVEKAKAEARGWGTFRVTLPMAEALPGEIVCPASTEAGKLTDCAACNMCDGRAKRNIVIVAHGNTAGKFAEGRVAA